MKIRHQRKSGIWTIELQVPRFLRESGHRGERMRFSKIIVIGMLFFFPVVAFSQGSCKGEMTAATCAVACMPRGATAENLEDYRNARRRCAKSDVTKIDKQTCRESLGKIYRVAKDLNDMVITGCQKYIPVVNQPSVRDCLTKLKASDQASCANEALEKLRPIQTAIKEFKAKLKEFKVVLNEAQEKGINTSTETAEKIEEMEKVPEKYSWTPHPAAQEFNQGTISGAEAFHNGQKAQDAYQMIQSFRQKFGNSEQYSNVTAASYEQKFQPIQQSWEQMDSVQSPMLKEQFQNYLNAEELKLAASLQDNQLTELNIQTEEFIKINDNTIKNLGPLAGLANGGKGDAAAGENSGMSGLTSDTPMSDLTKANSSEYKLNDGSGSSSFSGKSGSTGIDPSKGDVAAKGAGTEGSRSLASQKSLKDALRKKYGSAAEEMEASMANTEGSAGATGASEKEKVLGKGGQPLALAGGAESLLSSFTNDLGESFGLEGSSTDASIQEMLGELGGSQTTLSNDIGPTDGPSLFLRVREYHGRCVKRGCVVQGKGNI